MLYYILLAAATPMNQDTQNSPDWLDGAAVAFSALSLVGVVPLSIISLAIGFRRHRDPRIVAGGALGILLLIVGATVAHSQLGLTADRIFTIAGSLVLATSHWKNSKGGISCGRA